MKGMSFRVNCGTFKKKLKTFLFCKFYSVPCWTSILLYCSRAGWPLL